MSGKKFCPSIRPSVCPSVCLSVCLSVHTSILAVDTVTYETIFGGYLLYIWNVGLVLKSEVKSWSWSWSWCWTWFLFWRKLCETTPNLMGIFRTQNITFAIEFDSKILWSWSWSCRKKNRKKCCGTTLNFLTIIKM